MIFEPGEPGTGIEFSDEIVGGRIPREYIPAVEHAIRTESRKGQWLVTKSSSTSRRA